MLVDVSLLTKGFLVVLVIAWIAFPSIPVPSRAVPSNVLKTVLDFCRVVRRL